MTTGRAGSRLLRRVAGAGLLAVSLAGCETGSARSLVLLSVTAAEDVTETSHLVVEVGPVSESYDGPLRRQGVDEPLRIGLYLPKTTSGIVNATARAIGPTGGACGAGQRKLIVSPGKTVAGDILITPQRGFDCTGDGGAGDGMSSD